MTCEIKERRSSSSHLDECEAERSPHQGVDDRVDARVDVGQSFNDVKDHHRLTPIAATALRQYHVIQLERQPGDGERRGNCHAHPGDFASCLLLRR